MGVQEAEQMRESDEKKKEGVQAKNDAETLSYQVEKQLSELKDKMSTADAEELKKLTSELQEKSWAVTQAAYQSGSEQGTEESKAEEKTADKKEEKEKK